MFSHSNSASYNFSYLRKMLLEITINVYQLQEFYFANVKSANYTTFSDIVIDILYKFIPHVLWTFLCILLEFV